MGAAGRRQEASPVVLLLHALSSHSMDGRGEVAIMSIVLARVVVSLFLHGLFYELAGLVFLSFAALLVEFAASHYGFKHFNPRSGTSSGIYVAVLSVPIVLVARLIQHFRMSTTFPNLGDPGGFRIEFWSAFAGSVGLLVFILHTLDCQKHLNTTNSEGKLKASFYSIAYWKTVAVIIPSLSLLFPVKLMSALFHVIGSTFLLEYQVHAFPGCVSLGEAVLVANGLAVYAGNAITYTFVKVGINASSELYNVSYNKDSISAILQGTLIGLMWVPQLYKALGKTLSWVLGLQGVKLTKANVTAQKICKAAAFYLALILALMVFTAGWLYFVHGLPGGIVMWVIDFTLLDPQRLYLCCYWVVVLCTSVLPFYIAKRTNIEQIMVRKYFHLMVVIMFIPALLYQQIFLKLAFSVAFAGFLVVEMIRVLEIPPLGEVVYSFMAAFTDSRDSDILIISHFSLLLGCSLPLWLTNMQNDRPLAPFAGVLSLGIGDTMASVIGYNYGSVQLSRNNKKTIEGTIAGIASMLIVCIALQQLFMTSSLNTAEWISLTLAVMCTGLMEAYTTQLDNAFLPLIFFSLLIG